MAGRHSRGRQSVRRRRLQVQNDARQSLARGIRGQERSCTSALPSTASRARATQTGAALSFSSLFAHCDRLCFTAFSLLTRQMLQPFSFLFDAVFVVRISCSGLLEQRSATPSDWLSRPPMVMSLSASKTNYERLRTRATTIALPPTPDHFRLPLPAAGSAEPLHCVGAAFAFLFSSCCLFVPQRRRRRCTVTVCARRSLPSPLHFRLFGALASFSFVLLLFPSYICIHMRTPAHQSN